MEQIKSPLAKLNPVNGQLSCILCNAPVKSAKLWIAHINGRQHRQSLLDLKAKKSLPDTSKKPALPQVVKPPKRPAEPPKSILKHSSDSSTAAKRLKTDSINNDDSELPEDFFDKSQGPSVSLAELEEEIESESSETTPWEQEVAEKQLALAVKPPAPNTVEALPEGFFDDKEVDAKVRKAELKDDMEEEWVKFQKEIKQAEQMSNAIMEEEDEAMTADRELEEIDKQIEEWGRVNKLEKKKEEVDLLRMKIAEQEAKRAQAEMEVDNNSEDEVDIDVDALLDWRSKGFSQ